MFLLCIWTVTYEKSPTSLQPPTPSSSLSPTILHSISFFENIISIKRDDCEVIYPVMRESCLKCHVISWHAIVWV